MLFPWLIITVKTSNNRDKDINLKDEIGTALLPSQN